MIEAQSSKKPQKEHAIMLSNNTNNNENVKSDIETREAVVHFMRSETPDVD